MTDEHEYLDLFKRYLRYEDGHLYWTVSIHGAVKSGDRAGTINGDGYWHVQVKSRRFQCHRVIWFLVHGSWTRELIDHIDGDRANNRIENLRLVSLAQNQWNAKTPVTNKSGIKGVSFHSTLKKWQANIRANGKIMYLGLFNTKEEAAEVVRKKRIELHGEFANHG